MSTSLTLRLPDNDADEVRRIARKERRSISEVGARIVDEWLRQNRFPDIEFRSAGAERVAFLKGRIEVWQVVMVVRRYVDDLAGAAAHLDLRPEQVQAALDYAAVYSDEIEAALADNREGPARLKRLFPRMGHTIVTDAELAALLPPDAPSDK
jgi:hypothetical protein